VCGQVRVERTNGEGVRALIAVFAADEAIALATAASANATFDPLRAGPLTLAPQADGHWRASVSGDTGDGAFTLVLEPAGEALRFDSDGVEQPCRARGEVTHRGRQLAIDGPAQIGRGSLAPADEGSLERDLAAWLDDGMLIAVRATGRSGGDHDRERVVAQLADVEAGAAEIIDEARLSTTYAGDGHQRRAGLELWPNEDSDYPRRIAGETLCAATLVVKPDQDGPAAPGLRWDIAFLDWRMEGRQGIGPYSLLRR
jgi:hypothetical protein